VTAPRRAEAPDILAAGREAEAPRGAITLTFPWGALASSNLRNTRRGGRAHSHKYKTSREAVALLAMGQVKDRPAFPEGPLSVVFRFWCPDYRRRDEINLTKGLADGLNGIAWGDDSQITDTSILRVDVDEENPRCEVTVGPYWRRL
jgi:Holliday junction resolvase RusA-like endonuclease